MIRFIICGAMATARLLELRRSRRNLVVGGVATEGRWSRRTYPLMVALHAGVLVGTLVAGSQRPSWPWLALLGVVQPLRWWVLLLLGRNWNTRGAVAESIVVETRGPYALIRHPNYLIVVIELIALPLAFNLRRLAMIAAAANTALLFLRIRDEEQALMVLPEYRAHFEAKRRFIPYLF